MRKSHWVQTMKNFNRKIIFEDEKSDYQKIMDNHIQLTIQKFSA